MELEQVIVLLIAAWGAILSTIIYLQKLRDDHPKIIVDGFVCDDFDEGKGISLIVRNFGKKSITLSWAIIKEVQLSSITEKFLDKLHIISKELESSEIIDRIDGIEVIGGKSHIIFFSFYYHLSKEWVENHKTCRGVVVDQLGKEYRSKIIKL
jgi:hypothetical protein